MFKEGDEVKYTRFMWSTESDETDVVKIVRIVNENIVFIDNPGGTLKRTVRMCELDRLDRPTPFGSII